MWAEEGKSFREKFMEILRFSLNFSKNFYKIFDDFSYFSATQMSIIISGNVFQLFKIERNDFRV